MKKLLPLFLTLIIATGCVALLPSISTLYPAGYSKLVLLQPECQSPELESYPACRAAANMLESSTPEEATSKFLNHWYNRAFSGPIVNSNAMASYAQQNMGKPKTEFQAGLKSGLSDANAYKTGSEAARYEMLQAAKRIVVPVLKKIYETNNNAYAGEMLKHVDSIDLESIDSFNTFNITHLRAQTSH